jgi:hypothetical protein
MKAMLGLEFLVRLVDHLFSSVAQRFEMGPGRARRYWLIAIGTTLHDVR